MLDVAIIGSGPAALTAAIYIARAGLKAKVFERGTIGGALSQTAKISNYPGFIGTGSELVARMQRQALDVGAEIDYGECTKLERVEDAEESFRLTIDEEPVDARSVLVATGSEPKELGFAPNPPVSYCALCDAEFAKGKHIAVIGGANSAVQEAIYLSPLVHNLTLITHSQLKADQVLVEKLRQCHNVTIKENLEPTAALLNQFEYVFVFIGKRPATGFLRSDLLNDLGYIKTGRQENRTPHETIIHGLFAAGDVRENTVHQVVTAAGDGAAAATEIIKFLHK